MPLFDTHLHLDDERFEADREGVIERARSAGVETLLAVATTAESSAACVRLAEQFSAVFASVGIQPNYVAEAPPGAWDQIEKLAALPRVVALGETGLDRYWDHAPFPLQKDFFDRHLRLSQQLQLPFIVHMRDCEADVLEMLRAARRQGPLRGVMHSFTGSTAGAAECLELGLYVSFAGMVTYPKSTALRETAATIPDDRLLIETDAPYLSPHPHRSRRPNEPALLVHTAACLAEVRGVTLDELSRQTYANSQALFTGVW